MQYSLEKIDTAAACDTLLASAQKKKQTLERKRRNLGESIDAFRARLDQIDKDTALVQTLLIAYTAAHEALPEGTKYKASMNVKVKRLELRQARLDKKAFTCNVLALLAKQVKYNMLDSQVAAIDRYITAVQNKRKALTDTTLHVTPSDASSSPSVVLQKSQPEKTTHKTQTHFSRLTEIASKQLLDKKLAQEETARQSLFWNSLTEAQKNEVRLPDGGSKDDRNPISINDLLKPSSLS